MKKAAMLLVLFAVVAAMAQTPKQSVAVYMAGREPTAVKGAQKVLGAELAKALAKSGKYTAVDRTDEVIKVLSAAEIFRQDGAIDVDKAKRVGKQLGAQVVCVAEISEVMQSYFLEARLVNVETAEVSNVGSMYGNMRGAEDVVRISQAVARELIPDGATLELAFEKRKIVDYTYREIAANPDMAIKDYTEAIRQEPDVVEYYYKRSYAYYVKKESDMIIMDCNEVIRLNPNDADAYYNRGNAYFDKKDYDRAISDYNQAIRLDPNYAIAYNNRGNAYSDKKDYDRAIADYNQAIRLDPNNVEAYYNRGGAYSDKKDYDRAIADYNQAIRLDPNNTKAYYNRGIAYDDKKDYNRAIADYNQVIRLNPNNTDAYINRGVAYAEKGDYDRAIADYNQVIQLNPNDADAYYNRGRAYRDKKDYDRAIADWESALKIDPNNAEARNNLEAVKKQLNSNSEGVSGGADAIQKEPNVTEYNSKIDYAYDKNISRYEKQLEQCRNQSTVYIRNDKDDKCANAMFMLGSLYSGQAKAQANRNKTKPDYGKSMKMYYQLVQVYPTFPKLPDAFLNMANDYLDAGHLDTTRIILEQLLNRFPNGDPKTLSDAYSILGEMATFRNYDLAFEHFNKAIRLNPKNVDAYYYRANAWRNARNSKKDYDRAIDDYSQAIRLNPKYVDVYFNRGVTYFDKKDYKRAIADFESILRIDPNNADAKKSLEAAKKQLGK